jgi:hypothetical protein
MNELNYGLARQHMSDLARASPRLGYGPELMAPRRDRFASLQQRLSWTTAAVPNRGRRSVVVLPSRSLDRWFESPHETRSYEERLLSFLLELRDPALELTYVTSLPVSSHVVDYYISLLPSSFRLSARKRLRLVSLGDRRQRPLSEKLLGRPRVLEQIRRTLADPNTAHLLPYNSTELERDIALALDIPLYGADPAHARFGTKSGGRELFEQVGVAHPLGAQNISTIDAAVCAIRTLRVEKPELSELVIKLDNAVSGEGNAVVALTGLPAPGTPGEDAHIERRIAGLMPEAEGVTADAYLRKLVAQGGVIEERITGRELRSPSVQLQIAPAGAVHVLSTHDQILGGRSGQQFVGCRFPADPSYAPGISALACRAAEHLAEIGVIGRLSIDFLVSGTDDGRWQPFALEVNLRMGGTTHPFQTLARLTGGSYNPLSASFATPQGLPRHYVASDHLEIPRLRDLGATGVLAQAVKKDLHFDHRRGRGAVFHMLSSVRALGIVGVTTIAEDPESAGALHEHVHTVLAGGRGRKAFRAPIAPARVAIQPTG